jgi:hypothetical protein
MNEYGRATLARTSLAQVALLTQLKIFQTIGRFPPVKDIPVAVIAHVAASLATAAPDSLIHGRNRLYRDHAAIRSYLRITSWGPATLRVAQSAMAKRPVGEIRTKSVIGGRLPDSSLSTISVDNAVHNHGESVLRQPK